MKKTKAFLALVLSIIMIVSVIPASTKVKASYMPMNLKFLEADLSDLTLEQMKAVSIEDQIIPKLKDLAGNPASLSGNVLAYTFNPGSNSRDYIVFNAGDKLNLLLYFNNEADFAYESQIELICGEKLDQLNMDNNRYVIHILAPDNVTKLSASLKLTDFLTYPIIEADSISFDKVTENLKDSSGSLINPEGVLKAYSLYDYGYRSFVPVKEGDTLDLIDDKNYSSGAGYNSGDDYYVNSFYNNFYTYSKMLLVYGESADEAIGTNDKFYEVSISCSKRNGTIFEARLLKNDEEKTSLPFALRWNDQYYTKVEGIGYQYRGGIRFYVDGIGDYNEEDSLLITLDKELGQSDGTPEFPTIVEGYYNTIDEVPENPTVLNDILKNGYEIKVYESKPVTFIYKSGDKYLLEPYYITINDASILVNFNSFYKEGLEGRIDAYYSINSDYVGNVNVETITLYAGDKVDEEYYISFYASKNGYNTSGVQHIKKAVIGLYDSLEAASEAEDIKEALFSYASSNGGYKGNFENGIDFTIFTTDGQTYKYTVKVQEGSNPRSSYYTGVDFNGAYSTDGNYLSSYQLSSGMDSYVNYGYQTILLADRNASGAAVSIEVGSKIKPTFYKQYSDTNVYAGQNGASGEKQQSGVSEITYDPSNYIPYTAVAYNGVTKNYFVTYVSPEEGPKLFVNGSNDPYNVVVDGDTNALVREVIFDRNNTYHDIVFANIGNEDIKDMYIKLEDAQNVKLDDYWNLGDTVTLSAFDTLKSYQVSYFDEEGNEVSSKDVENGAEYDDTKSYSNVLANLGKIRLVPENIDNSGSISGTLVIGFSGNGDKNQEIKIKLVGMLGEPKIITESIIPGVKYVPYSSLIQNNCSYVADELTYTVISGELPEGITLKKNGEIYGVPTKYYPLYDYVDGGYYFDETDGKLYDSNKVLVTEDDGCYIEKVYDEETDSTSYKVFDKDGNYVRNAVRTYRTNDEGVRTYYGIRFRSNTYSFRVSMEYKYTSRLDRTTKTYTDSKYFYLYMNDNTEENIEAINNSEYGYKVLDYLDAELNLSGNGETLRSEGVYADFIACYLDGVKLEKDTDYTTEEGSTKITISDKTLSDAGLGEHTIAAEFRTEGKEDGQMKASAQKFEIKKLAPTPTPDPTSTPEPTNNSSSSSNSESGSGSSSNTGSTGTDYTSAVTPTPTVKPTADPTPTPKVTETKDDEGNVTKVTETTAADKSKVVETKVEKKNGNTRTTTEYIDATGKTTKVEEVKSYKNKYGTKVNTQKTEKADGTVSYKEVRNRKNGETVTKTLKTDSNGNTTITTELVKKNGKKVTKSYSSNGNGTVELKKCKSDAATVKVPATLNIDGKKYPVTSIAKKAFAGNTVLTEVVIGSKVKSISAKAFYGCTSLETIKVNAKLLETVGSKAFGNISSEPKFIIKASEDVFEQEKATIKKSKVVKAAKWERK